MALLYHQRHCSYYRLDMVIQAESVAAFYFCYDGLNFTAQMKCKYFASSIACPYECNDIKTRRTGPHENNKHRQELNTNVSAVPISHDRTLFNS